MTTAQDRIDAFEDLRAKGLINKEGIFFPTILYPPMNLVPPIGEETLYQGYQPPADGMFNFYVHVPFCLRQCTFCHIPIITGSKREDKAAYLDTLALEIDLLLARLGVDRLPTRAMLLGGGTPTNFPVDLFERFLDIITRRLDLSGCSQIAVDLDPGTVLGAQGQRRLELMRAAGISRLAFGVQSLRDDILRDMHRSHNVAGVQEAVRRSKALGFKVNIELIYGYPGQTLDSWSQDLDLAVGMGVDELQLYRLKVIPYRERKGRISGMYAKAEADFPDVYATIRMKHLAAEQLGAKGYSENMRRFFTRTRGDYSHYFHNWNTELQDQVGVGHTAFSYLRDRYGQNTRDMKTWHEAVRAGRLPLDRGLQRDHETQVRWALSLPLKNREITAEVFERATGVRLDQVFQAKAAALEEHGLLERDARGWRLSALGGFFADEVTQQFHAPEHIIFPRQAYADGPLNPYRDNHL